MVELLKPECVSLNPEEGGSLWWPFRGMWSKLHLFTFLANDLDEDIEVMLTKLENYAKNAI